MKLFNRLSSVVKADAHGVVDALEDRELLIKQHLREAEIELDRKRARMEALDAEAKKLEQNSAALQKEIQDLDEDIELALKREKEDLARFAIRRLLPLKEDKQKIETRLVTVTAEQSDLKERLIVQEQDLDTLKARARAFVASIPKEPAGSADSFNQPIVADEEVEMEILRRQKKQKKGAA